MFESGFDYSIDTNGVVQGAEARIYQCMYLGRPAVLKERFSKKYRHSTLDTRMNISRTKNELKGIVKAQQLGVATPGVFFVENDQNRIIMEKISGLTAKDWIELQRNDTDASNFQETLRILGDNIGRSIGKLHVGNLVHGDLTTSNVILRDCNPHKPVFIDFGLSLQGKVTPEEKGVDLYVLERAIASTHQNSSALVDGVLSGYCEVNAKQGVAVMKKLEEIRLRGRKRDMIG